MDFESNFLARLKSEHIDREALKLAFNDPLGPKTTFGIGGPQRYGLSRQTSGKSGRY